MYTLLERIFSLLFGVGSFFFLIRVLSKESFGVWAIFLAVTSVIEVGRNGLIQNAQIKYLSSSGEEEHPQIITASTVLNVLLTLLSVLVIVCFAHLFAVIWKNSVLQTMLYIYTATTILLIPCSQFSFIQQANLDFKGIFWTNFARQGIMFFYILIACLFKSPITLINLTIVQIVSAASGAIIAFFTARKFLVWTTKVDWAWVKKLFHFGKYVFGTNVSSMFFKSMDQLMLGYFIGPASVAVYNTAVRISNLVEVPTTSIASIVFPQSARRVASEGLSAVKYLYERSVALIIILILPFFLAIIFFPEFIITLVAGAKYTDTAPILQVTILYSMFIPFLRQFGTALDSIGKPRLNFYFLVFCAVLNFVFNYIFIGMFGTIGAAYGTLTSYAIIFVLNQFILKRELNVNTFSIFYHIKDLCSQGYAMGIGYCKKIYRSKFSFTSISQEKEAQD